MPLAFASSAKDVHRSFEAQIADVGADDGRRAIGQLDGALHVHAAHRPTRADEPRAAAGLEFRSGGHHRCKPRRCPCPCCPHTTSDRSARAQCRHSRCRDRGLSARIARMPKCARRGLTASMRSGSAPSSDDVVHLLDGRIGDVVHDGDFDLQRLRLRLDPAGRTAGTLVNSTRAGARRSRRSLADRVVAVWLSAVPMIHVMPPCFKAVRYSKLIRGDDTRPRFGQRAFGVAGRGLHGDQDSCRRRR